MAYIPEDMIFEILTQLPVPSLLRFKCVSKTLRDLIDSPCFVKYHLKLSNKSHYVMMFLKSHTECYADLDPVLNAASPPVLKESRGPWGGNCGYMCYFVGICNGLLCVYKYNSSVFLWNPSTRKHVQFPVPQHLWPTVQCRSSWGFGYNSDSDDYKVAVMTESSLTKRYGLWVYSLKRDLWEELEECPYLDGNWWGSGVFVNGSLHWLVFHQIDNLLEDVGNCSIVALDLGNFHWRMLDATHGVEADSFTLAAVDGCLHALAVFYLNNYVEIWFMNEYEVKESWKKRFVWYNCPFFALAPLAYPTVNGCEMLLSTTTSNVVLYDFEVMTYREIDRWSWLHLGEPVVYIPSLIIPKF